MANILLIDDDAVVREFLNAGIKASGHAIKTAKTLKEGMQLLSSYDFALVLLDVNLPDGDGIEMLPEIKKAASEPEVLIITADGSRAGARIALENDAWDYLVKPFSIDEIKLTIKQVLEFRSSKKAARPPGEFFFDRSSIIGSSPKLEVCLKQAQRCAERDANVLITGPTGTGKELFASTIHKNSNRKKESYVVVDCAVLPEQIVESVLFGNVKGAFTGADSAKEGLVKKAHGGTLFLDEIGELSLSIQKKFLRILQERKFKPVGGTNEIESNFRLICATNRDLEQMVKEEEFRSDLLFRIKTFHIHLPPLNECRSDIKLLVLFYINKLCDYHKFETKGFKPEFLELLESYDWPGNVRELINSLERSILSNPDSDLLYPKFLPKRIRLQTIESSIRKNAENLIGNPNESDENDGYALNLPLELLNPIKPLKLVKNHMTAETEKLYLKVLMEASHNNMGKASQMAGISKSRLYSLLKSYQTSQ